MQRWRRLGVNLLRAGNSYSKPCLAPWRADSRKRTKAQFGSSERKKHWELLLCCVQCGWKRHQNNSIKGSKYVSYTVEYTSSSSILQSMLFGGRGLNSRNDSPLFSLESLISFKMTEILESLSKDDRNGNENTTKQLV